MTATLIRTVSHGPGVFSTCSVRTDTYASSFGHFIRLADAAYDDFPELTKDDIECVVYGGERIKRIRGIEFQAKTNLVPSTYRVVPWLENRL